MMLTLVALWTSAAEVLEAMELKLCCVFSLQTDSRTWTWGVTGVTGVRGVRGATQQYWKALKYSILMHGVRGTSVMPVATFAPSEMAHLW